MITKTGIVQNKQFNEQNYKLYGNAKVINGVTYNLDKDNRDTDYITLITPDLWTNLNNWHFQIKRTLVLDENEGESICYVADHTWGYFSYKENWNSIALNVYDTENQQIFIAVESVRTKFTSNVPIIADIYYSNETGYNFTLTQSGTTYQSSVSSNTNKLRYANSELIKLCDGQIELNSIKFETDEEIIYSPAADRCSTSKYQTTAREFCEI